MAKKRLIVGNWKMYIESEEAAKEFVVALRRKARGLPGVETWLAPPLTLLPAVAETLSSSVIQVGAQTISPHESGAHTGDVSGKMLKAAGASFVIVGHSERRAALQSASGQAGESDDVVRSELMQAERAGLTPILCIGEREREATGAHFEFLAAQLASALRDPSAAASSKRGVKKLIIAYEPVWAIGKSAAEAMHGSELEEVVIFIKKTLTELTDRKTALKVPILYGGSVDMTNASELIQTGGVSGFLVGRASTEVESLVAILKAVRTNSR